MARTPEFIIEEKRKGDDQIVFEVHANLEYSPNYKGMVLERPYDQGLGTERKDGWTINPNEAVTAPVHGLMEALKLIDGVQLVEISNYWMRIKIAKGFKREVNNIMMKVMGALEEAWPVASFRGFSPHTAKDWKEFRFEETASVFLPRLTTTMFGDSDGLIIQGSWESFEREGAAFACGFKIDSISRVPEETDSWTLEMARSLGGEEPELVMATCTTPWRINRTGRYEDGGQELYGAKLHFDTRSGKGVIYEPNHK